MKFLMKNGDPEFCQFLEHPVVELLVAMGYGASRQEAGETGQVVGTTLPGGRISAMDWILGKPAFRPEPGGRILTMI